jgi:hypothetical protein
VFELASPDVALSLPCHEHRLSERMLTGRNQVSTLRTRVVGRRQDVLRLLRAKRSWSRAVALVVMLAFGLGLSHTHAAFASVPEDCFGATYLGSADHAHKPGDADHTAARGDCAFCVVFAGKLFVPAWHDIGRAGVTVIDRVKPTESSLESAEVAGLFRPPITVA